MKNHLLLKTKVIFYIMMFVLFILPVKSFAQSSINGIEMATDYADDPENYCGWRLKNANKFEVKVHYKVEPDGEEGDIVLPPSGQGERRWDDDNDENKDYTYFQCHAKPDFHSLKIYYGHNQILVSMGKKCDHHGNKYEKFKKWSMAGDAVSSQAVLGTTNNQSLRLVANDTLRMEIKPNGDVQVNKNMNIDGKLDVGTINYNSLSLNTGNTPRLLINPAGDILVNNNLSVTGLINTNTINGDNLLFKTGNQPRMSIFPDGNISINNNLTITGFLNANTITGENLLFKTGNLPLISIPILLKWILTMGSDTAKYI